jgi:hypothetical protein
MPVARLAICILFAWSVIEFVHIGPRNERPYTQMDVVTVSQSIPLFVVRMSGTPTWQQRSFCVSTKIY